MVTRSLLVMLCLFLPLLSYCQERNILTNEEVLTIEHGLTSRGIFEIYEASDGFVWFGTTLGLCRYDGVNFQAFDNKIVSRIFEDRNKDLWLLDRNATMQAKESVRFLEVTINRLNISTKEILNLNDNPDELPFLVSDISDINQDNDYNLWFTTHSGKIYKYDGESYELVYDNHNLSAVGGALPLDSKIIIFFENGSLITLDLQSGEKTREIFEEEIDDLFVDKNNRLWILLRQSFNNFNQQQITYYDEHKIFYKDADKPLTKYTLEDSELIKGKKFMAMWFDRVSRDGNVWCSTDTRIKIYDRNGKTVDEFSLPEELFSAKYMSIRLMKNTKGNIFWTRQVDGLHKFQIQKKSIKNILKEGIEDAVSLRGIHKLNENYLLVGNYFHGLIKYDLRDDSFKKIRHPVFPWAKTLVYGITKDEYGRIWTGTEGNMIFQYDESSDTLKPFQELNKISSISDQFQIPFWDTIAKKIWIGTYRNGLYYLDESKGSCFPFEQYNNFGALKEARVNCFHQKGEEIWAGSNKGVFVFSEEKGVIRQYENLLSKNIIDITEDRKGIFWLGTSDGLLKWNPTTNEQKIYTKKERFSDNYIYSVHIDEFGFLWMPSNLGLMYFNPETEEVNTLLPPNGLSEVEFNFSSNFTDENGVLYLGTVNGINILDPKDFINIKKEKIDLVITEYNVTNEEGELANKLEEFKAHHKIDFYPSFKSIQLKFALQDFTVTGMQKFAYKIGGADEDWTFIDENYIRINKLPFGRSELSIKGIGGKGIWSEPIVIPIKVFKPFYLSNPFIVSYVLLLLLGIYSFLKWRLTLLEKRQQKLEHLVEKRTEELSEKNVELEEANRFKDKIYSIIAHDLRGPAFGLQGVGLKLNYLIKTGRFEELQNFGGSVEESISNLNALLDNLLKWANQNMKSIAIKKEPLPLNDLIKHSLVEQKMMYSNKSITIENKTEENILLSADKQTVLTIFRNLIANAIKFTPENGKVTISSEQREKEVIIKIKDTGIGINPDRLPHIFDIKKNQSTLGTNGEVGTGLGLGVSMELALLNMGMLKVDSKEGEGATFYLELPAHCQEIYA